jgi:predicted branched-subunit amino acid permease
MSCNNNQIEKENNNMEPTFLSYPIKDYVKLVAGALIGLHFGNVVSNYPEITNFFVKNPQFNIFLLLAFFYLNSDFKIEMAVVCSIVVLFILFFIKQMQTQK